METLGIAPLVDPGLELAFFLGSAVLFPAAGVFIFRLVERRSRMRGDLHVH